MYVANACWLLIAVIPTVLILWMALDFMSHEYHYKTYGLRFWDTSPDKSLSVIIFILILIFGIHSITNACYAIVSESGGAFDPLWCMSSSVQIGWYATSKMFLYAFYVVRVHLVFRDSAFAVPLLKLKMLTLFVCTPIFVNACLGWYSTAYLGHLYNDTMPHDDAVNSFKDCSIAYARYTPQPIAYSLLVATIILFLTELIYWMIILRLFLSRVLLLSLSFNTMKTRMNAKSLSVSTNDPHSHRGAHLHRVRSETNTTDIEETAGDTSAAETKTKKGLTHAEKMELKNNELFLNLAIKTTNLIILSLCTNYVIAIKFGFKTSAALLMIDAVSNGFSVYVSYAFSSQIYDRFFGLCHTHCYGCCVRLCYCCCLRTKWVTPMLSMESTAVQKKIDSQTEIISDTEQTTEQVDVDILTI